MNITGEGQLIAHLKKAQHFQPTAKSAAVRLRFTGAGKDNAHIVANDDLIAGYPYRLDKIATAATNILRPAL